MKKSLILGLLLLPILLLSFVYPTYKSGTGNQLNITDTSYKLLVAYGEYVFGREGCINCHTLVEKIAPEKISLDGIGNKFPAAWHYMHLVDPHMMIYNSRMPSFKRLSRQEISVTTVLQLQKRWNIPGESTDTAAIMMQIRNPIDSLEKLFEDDKLEHENLKYKEIAALIFWLQKIKTSASKQISDSIRKDSANREYTIRMHLWKSLLTDHNSEYYKTATSRNKTIINQGKALFDHICSTCHGRKAEGRIGPNLTDPYWINGNRIEDISNVIRFGVNAMPAWEQMLTPEKVSQLVAYIRSVKNSNPPDQKEPQGVKTTD